MAFTEPKTWSAGDVLTASDMNTYVRDNIDFLSEPPRCRAYNSATQSIADASLVTVLYDSESFDTDTMHSVSSNTGRLTATTAGLYVVVTQQEFAANATGYRQINLLVDATEIASATLPGVSATVATGQTVTTLWQATAAQYFTTTVYQNSGGALNLNFTSNSHPAMSACWIGE